MDEENPALGKLKAAVNDALNRITPYQFDIDKIHDPDERYALLHMDHSLSSYYGETLADERAPETLRQEAGLLLVEYYIKSGSYHELITLLDGIKAENSYPPEDINPVLPDGIKEAALQGIEEAARNGINKAVDGWRYCLSPFDLRQIAEDQRLSPEVRQSASEALERYRERVRESEERNPWMKGMTPANHRSGDGVTLEPSGKFLKGPGAAPSGRVTAKIR